MITAGPCIGNQHHPEIGSICVCSASGNSFPVSHRNFDRHIRQTCTAAVHCDRTEEDQLGIDNDRIDRIGKIDRVVIIVIQNIRGITDGFTDTDLTVEIINVIRFHRDHCPIGDGIVFVVRRFAVQRRHIDRHRTGNIMISTGTVIAENIFGKDPVRIGNRIKDRSSVAVDMEPCVVILQEEHISAFGITRHQRTGSSCRAIDPQCRRIKGNRLVIIQFRHTAEFHEKGRLFIEDGTGIGVNNIVFPHAAGHVKTVAPETGVTAVHCTVNHVVVEFYILRLGSRERERKRLGVFVHHEQVVRREECYGFSDIEPCHTVR